MFGVLSKYRQLVCFDSSSATDLIVKWPSEMKSTPLLIFLVIVKVTLAFNITLDDGSVYFGEVGRDDLPVGEGKLLYLNGDVYEWVDYLCKINPFKIPHVDN